MTQTNAKGQVVLNKANIIQDINNGMTRPEIAQKYGITRGALKKKLIEAGITNKASRVGVVWDDETTETAAPAPAGDSAPATE